MELYIEKDFIDNFYLEVDLNNIKPAEQILINIFKSYGDVETFMDVNYSTVEELETLKLNNPFISYLFNSRGPISVPNIKDHFFQHSKCEQTLIFMKNEEQWFEEAEKKGAMTFSLENYSKRITGILEWVDSLDIDIDEFQEWDIFSYMCNIPFNMLTICDNYILVNKNNQQIDSNIIPFMQFVLQSKEEQQIPIKIYTKDLNPPQPGTPEQIMERVKSNHRLLNSRLANYKVRFKILNTAFQRNVDIHAREVINNFVIIRSGKGFNLVPPPKTSNETISADSIFNKNGYKRIKKRLNFYRSHEAYLNQMETLGFKFYPE